MFLCRRFRFSFFHFLNPAAGSSFRSFFPKKTGGLVIKLPGKRHVVRCYFQHRLDLWRKASLLAPASISAREFSIRQHMTIFAFLVVCLNIALRLLFKSLCCILYHHSPTMSIGYLNLFSRALFVCRSPILYNSEKNCYQRLQYPP